MSHSTESLSSATNSASTAAMLTPPAVKESLWNEHRVAIYCALGCAAIVVGVALPMLAQVGLIAVLAKSCGIALTIAGGSTLAYATFKHLLMTDIKKVFDEMEIPNAGSPMATLLQAVSTGARTGVAQMAQMMLPTMHMAPSPSRDDDDGQLPFGTGFPFRMTYHPNIEESTSPDKL
jgi:hypothetical protein